MMHGCLARRGDGWATHRIVHTGRFILGFIPAHLRLEPIQREQGVHGVTCPSFTRKPAHEGARRLQQCPVTITTPRHAYEHGNARGGPTETEAWPASSLWGSALQWSSHEARWPVESQSSHPPSASSPSATHRCPSLLQITEIVAVMRLCRWISKMMRCWKQPRYRYLVVCRN